MLGKGDTPSNWICGKFTCQGSGISKAGKCWGMRRAAMALFGGEGNLREGKQEKDRAGYRAGSGPSIVGVPKGRAAPTDLIL